MTDWKWYGNAGHFICSRNCLFHLCTQVGSYLVSTVGQYFPDADVREICATSRGVVLEGTGDARRNYYMKKIGYEKIGADRLYETMVFRAGPPCTAEGCDCGMPVPEDWIELEMAGYNDARSATEGHMAACKKWSEEKP